MSVVNVINFCRFLIELFMLCASVQCVRLLVFVYVRSYYIYIYICVLVFFALSLMLVNAIRILSVVRLQPKTVLN